MSMVKWMGCGVVLAALGCGSSETPPASAPVAQGASAAGQKYLLSAAPEGGMDVKSARDKAEADQEIVVVGRIGGSVDPWVEGLAAFSVVDRSLKACSDIPGDTCPTPWDYCCEADVGKNRLLVKFVDDQGEVIPQDARELLGVGELATVHVRGQAKRDADGNLSLLANGIYVEPGSAYTKPVGGDGGHAHEHAHEHAHDHAEHADDHAEHEPGAPAAETPSEPEAAESTTNS